MRIIDIIREAARSAWATKVPTLLLALVAATMCCATLLTVGRSASSANEIRLKMEAMGGRTLSIIDCGQDGAINDRTLQAIRGFNTVVEANAVGEPIAMSNGAVGAGGNSIAVWPLLGASSTQVTLDRGRAPLPGEAIVAVGAMKTLGLSEPSGFLSTPDGNRQYPIVGSYTTKAPWGDLGTGAVFVAGSGQEGRELRVVMSGMESSDATVAAVLAVLNPKDRQSMTVDSPAALATAAGEINSQLAASARSLLVLIVGVGGSFVASVVLADVLIRRRDLGRRRTLGITRGALVWLVALRAGFSSLAGTILGGLSGWFLARWTAIAPPVDFVVATCLLAVLVALLGSLLPAVYAATRDPVRVMRTP